MTAIPAPASADAPRHVAGLPRRAAGGRSWLASCWALYTLTLRQHLHGKRWMVMAALFLLPAALAVLVRWAEPQVPSVGLEFLLAFLFIPQAILPLVALVYASGVIQDEQEEQTITYLLIRPIPKWGIYAVKLLASITTTIGLTVVFTLLTYLALYAGAAGGAADVPLRAMKAAAVHSLAVAAYCSLFGLISLLTKRSLVAGIVYIVVVEGVLANLPFGIRLATVVYYTRLIAYRSMEFVVEGPHGSSENIAADAWQFDLRDDPDLLDHPQLTTCVTVLLVGSLVSTTLAAWICTRREFHVKTPEKD